jgi:hypothetical protein
MNLPSMPAVVTDEDLAAAAAYRDADDERTAAENSVSFERLLFGPLYSTELRLVPADHEAVGAVLARCLRHGALESGNAYDLVCVAHALARSHGLRRHRLLAGIVLLAGEVTARTHYALITRQYDPHDVRALAHVISDFWPRPGADIEAALPGHPGMNLARMVTGRTGVSLPYGQQKALRVLGSAYSPDRHQALYAMARSTALSCRSFLADPEPALRTLEAVLNTRHPHRIRAGAR